ncbi:MAG: hypothetical protein ACRDND_32285, partial [Streptosporangiaceae bacterium]
DQAGPAPTGPGSTGRVTAGGSSLGGADDDEDVDMEEQAERDGDVTVPASPRPVVRQQRVTGGPQRRSGTRKKRR